MTGARVAVLGVGLIGGSIGSALRASGTYVCGYDDSSAHGEAALALGHVDEMVPSLEGAVRGCDSIVLAAPVTAIVDLLPAVDRAAAPGSTILDTGSVKRAVMDTVNRLPGRNRIVGGHPIAGKEESGPAAADGDLFRGRPFVLTPLADTRESSMAAALDLVHALGARAIQMTATDHDRLLARISHLPQILSTALAAYAGPQARRLAGPGLEDMTRLALSDPAMWRDILLANADYVLEAARELVRDLEQITLAVGSGEGDMVARLMQNGRQGALAIREGTA